MGTGSFTTSLVHGTSASLMVARRPGGYHSRPHTHACEQLNLLQCGELHVFCDERAFRLLPGDVLRIPAGAVHWSWNRTEEPCTPRRGPRPPACRTTRRWRPWPPGCFDDDERSARRAGPANVAVELEADAIRAVEARDPHVAA